MFELRVLTGLHRGAALPLCGNAWRIGAADDADLVLYDPGIAPYHGQLEKTADGWALSAQDGALCNAEGHTVEQIDALPPGTPFALGQIWLCIVAADTPGLTTAKRLQPQKKMFPLWNHPPTNRQFISRRLFLRPRHACRCGPKPAICCLAHCCW